MILLAGCSGGGGGAASPTEEGTDAPASGTPMEETETGDSMDGTPMEPMTATPEPDDDEMGDDDMSDDSDSSDLSPQDVATDEDPFAGATVFDGTTYNGSQQSSAVVRNDTANNRELIEYTDESGATSEVYSTEDYVAVRNGTTGEVEYGGNDSYIGSGIEFGAAFTALGPVFFVSVVEWEQSGTTTVDGEQATVFESDSFNETGYTESGLNFNFESSDVQSTDGRIVITSDGLIKSIDIEIETTQGTYGGDLTVTYDDITIDKPGWVDESQAPN